MSTYRVAPGVEDEVIGATGWPERTCREILPGDNTPPTFWTVYEMIPGDGGHLESYAVEDFPTEEMALAAAARRTYEDEQDAAP